MKNLLTDIHKYWRVELVVPLDSDTLVSGSFSASDDGYRGGVGLWRVQLIGMCWVLRVIRCRGIPGV